MQGVSCPYCACCLLVQICNVPGCQISGFQHLNTGRWLTAPCGSKRKLRDWLDAGRVVPILRMLFAGEDLQCSHLNIGHWLQAAYARERDLRLDLEAELSVMRSQLATFRSQVAEARITAGKKERIRLTFFTLLRADSPHQQLKTCTACFLGAWVVAWVKQQPSSQFLRQHGIQLPSSSSRCTCV